MRAIRWISSLCLLAAACGGNVDLRSLRGSGGANSFTGGRGGVGEGGGVPSSGGGSGGSGPATTLPVAGGMTGTSFGGQAWAGALAVGGEADTRSSWLAFDVDLAFGQRAIVLSTTDLSCQMKLSNTLAQEKHPALSPDGQYLAYVSNASGKFQIHLRTLATGEIRRVTALQEGASYPAWSPDGSKLAIVEGDADTTNGTVVSILSLEDGSIRTVFAGPTIQAGSPLTASFAGTDRLIIGAGSHLLSLNLIDGSTMELISPNCIPNATRPSVSPDQTRVAFADSSVGQPVLCVAPLDGSTRDKCASELQLPSSAFAASAPSWGPFGVIAAEGTDGILLFSTEDGTSLGKVTHSAGRAHNPSWAPANFSVGCNP